MSAASRTPSGCRSRRPPSTGSASRRRRRTESSSWSTTSPGRTGAARPWRPASCPTTWRGYRRRSNGSPGVSRSTRSKKETTEYTEDTEKRQKDEGTQNPGREAPSLLRVLFLFLSFFRVFRGLLTRLRQRQPHVEAGALPQLAGHLHPPFHGFHNLQYDRQPQPGAPLLGREERLENPGADFFPHARPVVSAPMTSLPPLVG